jgi:hypothetical protein
MFKLKLEVHEFQAEENQVQKFSNASPSCCQGGVC